MYNTHTLSYRQCCAALMATILLPALFSGNFSPFSHFQKAVLGAVLCAVGHAKVAVGSWNGSFRKCRAMAWAPMVWQLLSFFSLGFPRGACVEWSPNFSATNLFAAVRLGARWRRLL